MSAAPAPRPRRQVGALVAGVGLGLLVFCVLPGLVLAVVVPNFLTFGHHHAMPECKTNLKALYTAQRSYFEEKDTWGTDFVTIGFSPEVGRRYSYFMGEGAELAADRKGAMVATRAEVGPLAGGRAPGVRTPCPTDCGFVAACAGNLDGDATLDVWSISSDSRAAPDGTVIPAGQPYNDVNDVER